MSKKPPGGLKPIADVLQNLLTNRKSALSDQFIRWKVWQQWNQIVGEDLSKCSEPIAYQKGRLYIWVKTSARLQEIRFFEKAIVEKINSHLRQKWVRQIRFTVDRMGLPEDLQIQFPVKRPETEA